MSRLYKIFYLAFLIIVLAVPCYGQWGSYTYDPTAVDITGGTIDGVTDVTITDWKIGSPTYSSLDDLLLVLGGAGYISGGAITDNGDGTVDVAAGTGIIRSTDSATGEAFFFDWAAKTALTLTDNDDNLVYVDYNSGSPEVKATNSNSTVLDNRHSQFGLYEIYRSGTTLHIASHKQYAIGVDEKIQRYLHDTMPVSRATGLIVSETGTRNLAVTAGTMWMELNEIDVTAIDTSGADTFTAWYHSSGSWTSDTGQSAWDNANYDNGTDKTALGANKYAVHWLYLENDGGLSLVYSQAEYTTLAEAENATAPSSLPDILTNTHALLIGRLVFNEGDASALSVETAFTDVFSASGVTDHGALAGLADDDHTQYLLADGTRALTSDWDIGDTFYLAADEIRARDAAGLKLYDDGGYGLFVNDGSIIEATASSITNPFTDRVGTNDYARIFESNGLQIEGYTDSSIYSGLFFRAYVPDSYSATTNYGAMRFTVYEEDGAGNAEAVAAGTTGFMFTNQSTDLFEIKTGGDVEVSNGNLVMGTSGKGIDFSATSDATGMSSELLDDYEEGTWTPVVTNGLNNMTAGASNDGYYTKVGNQVTLTAFVQTTSVGSVTGSIRIGGLPYAVGSLGKNGNGILNRATNLNITAGQTVSAVGWEGNDDLLLYLSDSATGTTQLQASEWSDDGAGCIELTYFCN